MPEPTDHQYPHHRVAVVSPEDLAEDVANNRDRYHPDLIPHIENYLMRVGGSAVSSVALTEAEPDNVDEGLTLEASPVDLSIDDIFKILENDQPSIELTSEHANRLIDAGMGWAAAHYLYNFQGLNHQDIANRLIDAGVGWAVARYLDNFQGLSADIANRLIDAGKCSAVARYLYNFQGLSADIANRLIDAGEGGAVAKGLNHFQGLNHQDIANRLIDAGEGWAAAHYLYNFQGLNHQDIANRLFDAGTGYAVYAVADNLDNFQGLSADIANRLIDAGEGGAVARYLYNFQGLSADIANRLIDAGEGGAVAKGLNHFQGLNHQDIANRLIDAGKCSAVASNIDNFQGLNHQDIANRLIDAGEGGTVAENLDNFQGLNHQDIANRLFDAGIGFVVASNLDRFQGPLSERIAISLAQRGYGSSVAGNRDKFMTLGTTFTSAWLHSHIGDNAVRSFLHELYPLRDEDVELIRQMIDRPDFTEYPHDSKNPKEKDRWFGDMSFALLDGGFSKTAIGHIIRIRIEQGIESGIHDASQWLSSFRIPEKEYDITQILRDRNGHSFDPTGYEAQYLYDRAIEEQLFSQILSADSELRQRVNLSSKEGLAEQLFYSPELQLLYNALVRGEEPLYRSKDLTFEKIRARALEMVDEFVSTAFGRDKEEMTPRLSNEELRELLQKVGGLERRKSDGQISRTLQELKSMGQRRKAYVRDAQGWLQRHATSPSARLTKVWRDRGQALLAGTADNARAIEMWQKDNALQLLIDSFEESGELFERFGVDREDIMGNASAPIREELLRVLSAHDTLEAMSKLKKWRQSRDWQDKLLPEATIPVVLDDVEVSKDKPYRFDIIGADDPRGFTIGEDTGCCMTIEGVSNSCIKAGYKNRNAGFLALYTPSGDIAAQSFWYVHPQHSDTLVLDNIEANEGRDMRKVVEVYTKALRDYLATHPELGITKVHVGTGYTDVDLGNMPVAVPVPPISEKIYTDAQNQRLLLDLTAENQ